MLTHITLNYLHEAENQKKNISYIKWKCVTFLLENLHMPN